MPPFAWSSMFNTFNNRMRRRSVASIIKFDLTLTLVNPSPSSAWQEGIELSYAFALLDANEIDTILAPIRHGFRQNFNREGSAGGKWKELADWTVSERAALSQQGSFIGGLVPAFGPEHPILQRTGEYMMSWVDSGHPAHGREDTAMGQVGRQVLEGSEDRRAEELSLGASRAGGGHLPARPVNLVDEIFETAMKARIDAILTKYIQTVHP